MFDVLIATIAFPVPSEAFAGVEVRALIEHGAHVRVRALRSRHELADALLSDWRLRELDVTQGSVLGLVRGLWAMLVRPATTPWALTWLCRHAWRSPLLLLRSLALLPRIFDILGECERRPPDVVHLFWGHYPAVLGALVKRRLPSIHVSMSLGAYDLVYRFGPSIAAANTADSVWTHAQSNVEAIRSMGINNPRLEVLRRGLDLTQIPPSCSDKIAGRIVTVARLEENKGVDDAIRTFSTVHSQMPHTRLVVIGEGPCRRRLERLVRELGLRDRVRFTGATHHSAVFRELAVAEVFVLLTRNPSERLPNALKEAMACRCICITTHSSGIEELRAHASNPVVVAQHNLAEAAQHLLNVLSAPQNYEEAREAGREFLLRDFDSRVLAGRRLAVWLRPQRAEQMPGQGAQ